MELSTHDQPLDVKREIRRHGSYFGVDESGFVIKAASAASIQDGWRAAVEDVTRACAEHFGSALHSAYVRGSVAKGQAIEHVSDVDSIAAVTTVRPIERLKASWARDLCLTLMKRHPFASTFEMAAGSVEQARLVRPMQIVIQTQAVCVYGKDLSEEFPKARIGRDASLNFSQLARDIDVSLHVLQAEVSPGETRRCCTWIMKKVLRSCFELVMERERRYTRDLYLCYESFSRHYPARKAEMYRILDLAVNPPADRQMVATTLRDLAWLQSEIAAVFGPEGEPDRARRRA